MLAELLPGAARAAETVGDQAPAGLLPEEEPYVARASAQRRAEFTAARWCARQALAQLGYPATPILVGDRGAPRWPPGVTGSLTHSDGYSAAAVARTSEVRSLGIDAEPHAPLPDRVETFVTSEEERLHLAALRAAGPGVHWDRLLFCAKESTYKAWFPLAGSWLGFRDALVTFEPDVGTFTAVILVPGPVARLTGRWAVRDGLALTAVSLLTTAPAR